MKSLTVLMGLCAGVFGAMAQTGDGLHWVESSTVKVAVSEAQKGAVARVVTKNGYELGPDAVTPLIQSIADGTNVIWCDFNDKLLEPDGTLSKETMPDFLHPGPTGYRIWTDAILPHIRKCCGKK